MRHVIEKTGFADIEMTPIDSTAPQTPKTTYPFHNSTLVLGSSEKAPRLKEDTFKDNAMSFVHQTEAEFSTTDTALSAVSLAPVILTELSQNIPGLGAVLTGTSLVKDIAQWHQLQITLKHIHNLLIHNFLISPKNKALNFNSFTDLHPNSTHEQVLANTLLFVLTQLQRRSSKEEQVMLGKALQMTGSILTLAGLVTHGATAIPGIILGIGGTTIKLRITLRSLTNYISKKYHKELSFNRELHARYLYGLTLKHLVDTKAYLGDFSDFREARRAIELVENIPGDHKRTEQMAAGLVGTFVDLKDTAHFIQYGFWSIMAGIKT